jgi:hypothetical protein
MSASVQISNNSLLTRTFILIWVIFNTLGCGKDSTPSASAGVNAQCNSQSASFLVADGFLVHLCGCQGAQEQPGTRYTLQSPIPLTCHLSSTQSVVFFYFTGTAAPHQILSVGTPGFISSPIRFDQKDKLEVYPVAFQNPGTYSFEDPYTRISGQFIVP